MSRTHIHLRLNLDQARSLCDRVVKGAHSPSQSLAGLNALALLLGSHTEEIDRQGELYRDIRSLLSEQMDRAREELLGQQAAILKGALAIIDPGRIAQVHATLSREAFVLAVDRSSQDMPKDEMARQVAAIHHWCADAERRASDASPYPDALNWAAAGIMAQEYLAMQDLRTALNLLVANYQ